jgi:hypothetical protein
MEDAMLNLLLTLLSLVAPTSDVHGGEPPPYPR